MRINVSVKKENKVLHSGDYDVNAEGDIERAVSESMLQARNNGKLGEQWGLSIEINKAN